MPEIVRLYEEGRSLSQVGEKFGVAPATVGWALRAEEVRIRRPGGRSRAEQQHNGSSSNPDLELAPG
jgi:hypothetical protein